MNIFTLITLLSFVLFSCDSKDKFEKHKPNQQAVALHKKAMKFAMFEVEYNEKVDSAITLWNKAIETDPKYIEPHLSIIGFSTLKKDKTKSLEYCHRAQRIFKDYPEFIMIEGVIQESNDESTKANKLYKKALAIYEDKLIDDMDKNPDLELQYISCLYLNKKKEKAKMMLKELKVNNKQDNFYDGLTIETLMEGYQIIRNR